MNDIQHQSAFEELVATYYRTWFRYHPEQAVEAGVAGFSHLLTPFDEEAAAALVCLNNELLVSLNALERERLTSDQQLDYDVLYGAAWLESEYLTEVRPQRLDPSQMLPINAIYQLLVYELPNFHESLEARLRVVPAHLAHAKAFLSGKGRRIPKIWAESGIAGAQSGVEFLRDLPRHPKCQRDAAKLFSLLDAARGALADYARFLEDQILPVAHGEFACGRAYFDRLLQYRHFLNVDADALHAFGVELFARTERELKEAGEQLEAGRGIAELTRDIQSNHPAPEQLLDAYREQMAAARRFLQQRGLVSLPEREQLTVVETPVFLRHVIPFAAYHAPSPADASQQGYFYVTPATDKEQLAEHNFPGLMLTSVHEAYPGHHLQFVTANLQPAARTLPRLLNASATLYEGWALYCEQLMLEQGFLDRPAHRFLMLKDRLWRALRIILDVELHTRGLTIDEAASRMTQYLGFPQSQALADLRWYTQSPTVPMGYAVGWALINAARTQVGAREGEALRRFHDQLLSVGSIALPLALKSAFGESVWQAANKSVFEAVGHATA